MKSDPVQKLIRISLLIALEIVLSRFLSISTPHLKIGFAFVPLALCAMLYGPVWAGTAGALADFLGAILFPIGPYFPGFTLTNCLAGILFGLCLRRERSDRWGFILLAVGLKGLCLSLLLNTLWISMLYGTPYLVLLPTRVFQCAVEMPVQIIVLRILGNRHLQDALAGHTIAQS